MRAWKSWSARPRPAASPSVPPCPIRSASTACWPGRRSLTPAALRWRRFQPSPIARPPSESMTIDARPYRDGVGIALLNAQDMVFVGQRIDQTAEAWQMPQGGIDAGEDPLQAALREMEEEIGVPASL